MTWRTFEEMRPVKACPVTGDDYEGGGGGGGEVGHFLFSDF
jgi:hypothetical protein